MSGPEHAELALADARRLVQRAVDKAAQLGLRGGIAVVGASGGLITASRLDRGGPGGMTRARSKAWISATQQIPSTEHLRRMTSLPPVIAAGFVAASPEAMFPGAGGIPVLDDDGRVVAGIAASGATVSPFLPDGVAPQIVSANGVPANPEDLLIAYALDVPYVGQHGDDTAKWRERFGDLEVSAEDSLGMKDAPPAQQPELSWAVGLCDAVLAAAAEQGLALSVAVTDPGGDPIQQDRADGGVVAGPDVALATAATAARYGLPSEMVADAYGSATAALANLNPAPFLAVAGALPVFADGQVIGAVGVGGADPGRCAELVRTVLG